MSKRILSENFNYLEDFTGIPTEITVYTLFAHCANSERAYILSFETITISGLFLLNLLLLGHGKGGQRELHVENLVLMSREV